MFALFMLLAFAQILFAAADPQVPAWATWITGLGMVAFLIMGMIAWEDTVRRVEEHHPSGGAPSRLDLGPAAGSRTPAPGLKPRDASGTPTHRHTQARFEESVPRPLLLECGAARFGDDYCGWCGRMFDKPPWPQAHRGGAG